MRLLNLHENIFVTNELDIVWVLYCYHNNKNIEGYKFDSPAGMNKSLEIAGGILRKEASPRDNFINYQKMLMEHGFLKNKPMDKNPLFYLRD